MSSKIYGLKYLLYKVIPLKHLGQHISKRIAFSFSGMLPEIVDKIERETLEQQTEQKSEREAKANDVGEEKAEQTTEPTAPQAASPQSDIGKQNNNQKLENSRKYLIEKIITLFEASDESLQDLKKELLIFSKTTKKIIILI
jgi:trehalose/maltose hydrolase-like predicted phosphorylase